MRFNKVTMKKACYASLLMTASNAAVAEDVKTSFYGSLRLGIDYVDAGTVDDAANGRDFLSRIGAKASVSLTDSLTGIGKIEYGLRGDDGVNFDQNDKPGMHQVYIGLKGDFGAVTYGSQTILWHKFVRGAYFQMD
jgi:predicted porin